MSYKIRIIFILSICMLSGCGSDPLNNAALPLGNIENNAGSVSGIVAVPKDQAIENLPATNPADQPPIAEFSTSFKDGTFARVHNITIASTKIDQKIINPGDGFSFNEAIGPTTKNNGFMLGKIFIDGKDSKGYGGGVCQVSSTLYNAAEQAGMTITERHNHSKEVGYVEKNKDAATSYGVIDFKFTNNKPYPVKINSYIMGEKINVAIERV